MNDKEKLKTAILVLETVEKLILSSDPQKLKDLVTEALSEINPQDNGMEQTTNTKDG